MKLLERGRQGRSGRVFAPLMVEFARTADSDRVAIPTRVRFIFHRSLTEEAFLTQLRAAHEVMESLPDEAFEGAGGSPENSLFWDDESGVWRGTVTGFRDDGYFPPDVLG